MFEHVEGIRRKDRRGTLPAAGAAALVHVFLIALLVWGVRSKVLLAGRAGGRRARAGVSGGRRRGRRGQRRREVVSYVELAPAAAAGAV